MKFTFACKKISLNDSIKEYAEKKISKLDKYFPEEADAFVTFAVEKKNRCVVELTIRAANGTLFRARDKEKFHIRIFFFQATDYFQSQFFFSHANLSFYRSDNKTTFVQKCLEFFARHLQRREPSHI